MSHFEIVRTTAGWHARFVGANSRIIWWTESYKRRAAALRAVALIRGSMSLNAPTVTVDERAR